MSARPGAPIEERLIFAMGGGGFTMEPTNPLLDDFVLSLTREKAPHVLFLPTASGDTSAQIIAFQERFADRMCVPEHLSLFRLRDARRPLEEMVLDADIVYVGGGSMRNLLAIWRAHGLDRMLVRAWRAGTVLVGLSAGAMCWFQGGVTRSSGPPERLRRHPSRRLGRRRRRRTAVRGGNPRARRQLPPGSGRAARRRDRR